MDLSRIWAGPYCTKPAMGLERRVAYAQNKRDVVLQTEDAKEGVLAIAEKRAPVWKGR